MTLYRKILMAILIPFTWAVTCQAQVPSDNVVAYFPFNGDATDVSGNGNTTTNLTAVALVPDRLGKVNAAYSYNGYSSIIKLPNQLLPANTAFAISCWVYMNGIHTTTDQSQVIIDLRGQYQIALAYFQSNYTANPNSYQFYIYCSPNAVTITSPNNSAKLNTWQHLVANYGNNSMEFYIDGTLIGTQAVNPPGAVTGYNNTIGKDYNVSLNRAWVNGNIDEVIFYKRKLTSTEVKAIYDRQIIQSEIQELYAPIKVNFNYDLSGNRISRNYAIVLKSRKFINEPDSANTTDNAQYQESLFEKDSLQYTGLGQQVKIYPNPTKGQLKVEISGYDLSLKIGMYVYSSTGNLLQQKIPANISEIIDLSKYTTGIYILKIAIGDKINEWKIIKE